MKILKLYILLTLWAFNQNTFAMDAKVSGIETPNRVLFVGNSFSYFNNGLHNHVANLLRSAQAWDSRRQKLRLMTISGGQLIEHSGGLASMLSTKNNGGNWDAIILQGHSSEPIDKDSAPKFFAATKLFAKHIRDSGAKPVLLMTWAYEGKPEMTLDLERAYTKAGNALNALVLPVGLAFARMGDRHPNVNLYSPDIARFEGARVVHRKSIKHPSLAGTYLAACVVYAGLYQRSPVGLPYNPGLEPEVARSIQEVAWQTAQQYYQTSKKG
jgi:hypothetical protein